ncbi:MAG: c-type cytochrome [Azonexus sp.]|jgi:cytochrome c553|nr:c-type cytochrome [Azonexus sp.]
MCKLLRHSFIAALVALFLPVAIAQPTAVERMKSVQADTAALPAAVEAGKKAAFFCANCHGDAGSSKLPEVPNLAGQNPEYLLEQMRKFVSGERKDAFMQGLIKVLKEEERVNIALFYANTPVVAGRADAGQVKQGQQMFEKLCVRCHGDKAHGDKMIPRLAGQQVTYLEQSVRRYRDKTGERLDPLMAIATATLKNEDIKAIANYLTQLP